MSQKYKEVAYLLRGLLIGAGLGAFVAWLFFHYPSKDSGHIAAWVQAIGSIGAIGAAIFIMDKQRRDSIEQDKQKRIKALRYMLKMVDAADDLINGVIRANCDDRTNYEEKFRSILKWMEEVDPLERNLEEVALSFLEAKLQVRETAEKFDLESSKSKSWRLRAEGYLIPRASFEMFRLTAQRFAKREGLEIQIETRGYPESHLGTKVTVDLGSEFY